MTDEEKEKYLLKITELEKGKNKKIQTCSNNHCNYYLEVKKVLADRDAMREQAESVSKEYDRLSSDYQKLQV